MKEELHALANGQMMGRVVWDRQRDRLQFIYEQQWRHEAASYPLSLSMPLAAQEHDHRVVEPFLWGLLPDNDAVLRRWGERFHVSSRHAFQLLMHVGEECAGAVQFVNPGRSDRWLTGLERGSVKWLDEAGIAERMTLLLKDHSSSRIGTDAGQFSLAGAQPKTAFYFDPKHNRWGVPAGLTPTTHIFKPATGAFDGHAENEHFCLCLAGALGMPVASSEVAWFGDVPVIIVARYDRLRSKSNVSRIHQEDTCQALARMPHLKYQNQGGPSPQEIASLIREHSTDRVNDEARFVDALVFNWLISGTDAHAKNYSFLLASGGQVRLAPLYDLASSLPYERQIPQRQATLAMKIGGKYKLPLIGLREWKKLAEDWRTDFDALLSRIIRMIEPLPEAARVTGERIKAQGIRHDVIGRLVEAIQKRSSDCRSAMNAGSAAA